MSVAEYSEAAVEVLDILNYTNKEDVEKIPQSFVKFLTDISSKKHKTQFNYEQPVDGLNLRKQTRELLGFIYITWWANSEVRTKYKKEIYSNDIKKEPIIGKYNPEDIFKTKKEIRSNIIEQNEKIEETSIVEYNNENKLKKIFNKILNFFGLKKERG